jgi:hypothetical protein
MGPSEFELTPRADAPYGVPIEVHGYRDTPTRSADRGVSNRPRAGVAPVDLDVDIQAEQDMR